MKRTLGHRPLVNDAGRLKTFLGTTSGSGSGTGPADATYLTLSLHADLSAERRLIGGDGLAANDGGANGDYTLSVDLAGTSGLELTGVSPNKDLQVADSVAGDGLTIASKALAVNTGTGLTISGDAVILSWSGVPGTIQPDASAASGSSSYAARIDHAHAIVCAAPAANSVHVSSSAEGNATSFARSNHTHNLNEAIAPSWTGTHSFSADIQLDANLDFLGAQSITTTAGNVTITPAGDVILNPVGNDVLPGTGYDINLGTLSKKYLTLHCAELWVETLVAQDTIATIGGRILVGPTTTVTSDLAPAGTTIYVKHNQMASGDRAYMEADGKVEFIAITSAPGGSGPYSYSITRNLDGSGASQWYAGDAVFNTGTTGDGFIDLYSLSGVKTGTGPTIVGQVRDSSTYNAWTEHWAIGNLNGVYGYGADTYGVAFGKYSAADYITIDSSNGIRFFNSSDVKQGQLSSSAWTLGSTVGGEYVSISSSGVSLYGGGVQHVSLSSAGTFWVGDTSSTERLQWDATNGLRVYNASNVAVLRFPVSGNAQIVGTLAVTSPGVITAGAGVVTLDVNGLSIEVSTTASQVRSYSFLQTGSEVGRVSCHVSASNVFMARALSVAGKDSVAYIAAEAPTGQEAEAVLWAYGAGTTPEDCLIRCNAQADTSPFTAIDIYTDDILVNAAYGNARLRVGGGLYVGSIATAPDADDIHFDGNLKSMKNSTFYDVYAFKSLSAPLTSTSWDGDAKSDVGTSTALNLNTVFGVPKYARAVAIALLARDSAAWGTAGLYMAVGPTSTYWYALNCCPAGGDVVIGNSGVVPCTLDGSSNPTIYYQINASGASTMDCWIRIWGYWI